MKCEMPKNEVWVFAEQQAGELADVALELIAKGRGLADELGVPLGALLLGDNVESLTQTLTAAGADKVYLADDPRLAIYQTSSYSKVVIDAAREYAPQIFLFGATPLGRDLAPTVASALSCGLTADCTELRIEDGLLRQIRPAFGGNILATIVNEVSRPQMATVRAGVFAFSAACEKRNAEIVRIIPAEIELPVTRTEFVPRKKSVNLSAARIIVAGGAGVGSKENFACIRELASVLGGTYAGSRAAVDLGYLEHERQIGQTGTTVRPAFYIACGISGAIQHRAGMQDSAKILAINTDRDAPIFSVAHYGIVGDLKEIIPMIIKAVKR